LAPFRKLNVQICCTIKGFLNEYQTRSRVGSDLEGIYYWSERDAQHALLYHLRENLPSPFEAHTECEIGKRRTEERRTKADIAVIDWDKYQDWYSRKVQALKKKERERSRDDRADLERPLPEYAALIEVKLAWHGVQWKGGKTLE
jgi:hypothetical protein